MFKAFKASGSFTSTAVFHDSNANTLRSRRTANLNHASAQDRLPAAWDAAASKADLVVASEAATAVWAVVWVVVWADLLEAALRSTSQTFVH